MKLEFGFGTGVQTVEVPDRNLRGVLRANEAPAIPSEEEEICRALREPVGSLRLREIVRREFSAFSGYALERYFHWKIAGESSCTAAF